MKKLFDACLNADCDFIAVENPTPMSIWKLPPHSQSIQPWMFGEPYTKRTCLWLKNLPPLIPEVTEKPNNLERWVNTTFNHKSSGKVHGAKNRSKTFIGIAKAIATQWSHYIEGLKQ